MPCPLRTIPVTRTRPILFRVARIRARVPSRLTFRSLIRYPASHGARTETGVRSGRVAYTVPLQAAGVDHTQPRESKEGAVRSLPCSSSSAFGVPGSR